jgi:diacylglycerol kinase family enzyme
MRRLMLISNANAGSVTAATREVILKALQADFKVEAADTERRDHASDLAADAVDRDFEAVIAFGGDGTINEAMQPLVGTDLSFGFIPGGSTNVAARSLGLPRDPVDATAFVAAKLRDDVRRRVTVGRLDSRYFLFSAGMGLDAEVVKRVEADPEAKRKRGEWFFVSNAFKAGLTEYRTTKPRLSLTVDGHDPVDLILAICCNASPFTYFKRYAVNVCPEADLDGALDIYGLTKLRATMVPRLLSGLFVTGAHTRWRSGVYHRDIRGATFQAEGPTPVQVDGDYIGERMGARIDLVPDSLDLLV